MTDSCALEPEDLLYLGYVEKSHGLKGGFSARIFSLEGDTEIPPGTEILLDGAGPLLVTRCTPRGAGRVNITTASIRNREDADGCRGSSIHISRHEADEKLAFHPLFGLIGKRILSRGCVLTVIDLQPMGTNSLLLVEGDGRSFNVPLALLLSEAEFDSETGTFTVDLPEGMDEIEP